MGRTGRSTEMRHISFRMPADVHADYITVAKVRGVDLSAVLNWVLAEFRPVLLLRHATYMAAMLRATAASLPQGAPPAPDNQEELAKARELLTQIQEIASALAGQMDGEQRREAG